jgi:bifunctional non-homologous end joining protein LigD
MTLTTYNKKRNFKATPEPSGKGKVAAQKLTFVVQRHDASHLHYDFRLQLNGVLKSWAVPKGPSLNPGDKRLAVMVEDHPLSYGSFKGEIPKGNYGAGTVDIWDNGTYTLQESVSRNPQKEIEQHLNSGSLKFILHGKKLKGSFALVKLKDGKEKNWLLIKHKDEYAVSDHFDIEATTTLQASAKQPIRNNSVRSGKNEKVLDFIKPMLAHVRDKPFDDPNWIFEIKWDGYRAITEIKKEGLKLYSRNGLSFKALYPRVAKELTDKIKHDVVLDGEIVAFDENGKPSFQKLQNYGEAPTTPLVYYIFDCLSYKGRDITHLPLIERKKIVKKLLPKSDVIKYSDHVEATGTEFFTKMVEMGGLEGMIAKRAESNYTKGVRTNEWLKIKNLNTEEAVIAGFTAPRASRKYFGALVLGVYENGALKYIGHTGTGFTERVLKELHGKLQPIVRKTSPFGQKVPVNSPVTWVDPVYVCAIKFTEMTTDGILRHPVFMGLRVDKKAKEVNHLDVVEKQKKIKPSTKKSKSPSSIKSKKNDIRRIDGHEVNLTNQNKVYWPDEKITKGDVINYYNTVYKYIIPYLKDRPESLKRNPNGITDKGFYHKDAGDAAPSWVQHIEIYSEAANKDIDYIICNDRATLLYLNNLGCIEINPWNSRVKKMDSPDYLVIDIDPSDKNTFDEVIEVALATKEVLDKAGAKSYCKTSGATGLHVYVPLHAAYSYDQARSFAEVVAHFTNELVPKITTLERPLSKRKDRIYIDYLQNKRGQTLASAYSLRPVPGATVSTPLLWKEVKQGLRPSAFTIHTLVDRLAKKGDLFKGVLTDKTNIEKCIKNLSR